MKKFRTTSHLSMLRSFLEISLFSFVALASSTSLQCADDPLLTLDPRVTTENIFYQGIVKSTVPARFLAFINASKFVEKGAVVLSNPRPQVMMPTSITERYAKLIERALATTPGLMKRNSDGTYTLNIELETGDEDFGLTIATFCHNMTSKMVTNIESDLIVKSDTCSDDFDDRSRAERALPRSQEYVSSIFTNLVSRKAVPDVDTERVLEIAAFTKHGRICTIMRDYDTNREVGPRDGPIAAIDVSPEFTRAERLKIVAEPDCLHALARLFAIAAFFRYYTVATGFSEKEDNLVTRGLQDVVLRFAEKLTTRTKEFPWAAGLCSSHVDKAGAGDSPTVKPV